MKPEMFLKSGNKETRTLSVLNYLVLKKTFYETRDVFETCPRASCDSPKSCAGTPPFEFKHEYKCMNSTINTYTKANAKKFLCPLFIDFFI